MRIAIVTLGRFHVADLARFLTERGHDVTFYSEVPRSRLKRFGLTDVKTFTIWPVTIIRVLESAAKKYLGLRNLDLIPIKNVLFDLLMLIFLRRCDLIIGMAGIAHHSLRRGKKRFGAIWILERSSSHIELQKIILEKYRTLENAEKVSDWAVEREKRDYQSCDLIVVPSTHVYESFIERNFSPGKLFLNPLGVVLDDFPFEPLTRNSAPTLLMAGNWSIQKGCDILTEAWRSLPGTQLLHVGSVLDLPLPKDKNFVHLGFVDQKQIREVYARAHVLVLASYHDGFGVVLSQALACGLLVVCSDRTGGSDIRRRFPRPERIEIFKHGDVKALRQALERQLARAQTDRHLEIPRGDLVESLSVQSYVARYAQRLSELSSPQTGLLRKAY